MDGSNFLNKIGRIVCAKCKTEICLCARDSITAKRENKDIRVDTIGNPEEFDKIYPHLDVIGRCNP